MRTALPYLVQLEEDARSGFVVTVFVLLRALAPRRHIHVAHFARRWWLPVIADRPFLGTVRRRSWFLIFCKNIFFIFFFNSRSIIKSNNGQIYRENRDGDISCIFKIEKFLFLKFYLTYIYILCMVM